MLKSTFSITMQGVMRLVKSFSILILCLIPINVLAKQCFYVGENYFCAPLFNANSINWSSVNNNIQASGINWTSLNQNIQRSGVNWSSLNQSIQTAGINWTSVKNLEIQQSGINWSSIPNYGDGKTLKARPSLTYGINWE